MAMVLTDNLTDGAQFFAYGEVWSNFPNNFPCFFTDDCHDVCFTRIPDNIIWMEAFISVIIPTVWTQYAHGVDVHPVSLTTAVRMVVRIAEQNIFRCFRKP